jgi:heme/copper-type cytochrome/quinol oxidase subunit 2
MAERLRDLLVAPVSALLVLAMLGGCLFLWVGVPLGWLWIGSQVEGAASLGTAMMVTMVGVVATVIVVFLALTVLNRRHLALQERRHGHPPTYSPLEVILVFSAGVAVIGFSIWFFGFAGTSPIPINPEY